MTWLRRSTPRLPAWSGSKSNSPLKLGVFLCVSGADWTASRSTTIQSSTRIRRRLEGPYCPARLYAASLVTADATIRALLSGSPDQVALVAMGDNGIKEPTRTNCVPCICKIVSKGRLGDADAISRLILAEGEVGRFRDQARPY